MAENKQSDLFAWCKMLNVSFIKQIMDMEGYSEFFFKYS